MEDFVLRAPGADGGSKPVSLSDLWFRETLVAAGGIGVGETGLGGLVVTQLLPELPQAESATKHRHLEGGR